MDESNTMKFCFCSPCEAVTAITALAIAIAQGKSEDEIILLGTYFTQLGDTLITLGTAKGTCCDNNNNEFTEQYLTGSRKNQQGAA